jgi:competence protein ComEC
VITVEAAGRRLLLTGDIDGEAVDELIARGVPACDAMIAPHHGSLTSLPPRLAEAVRPRVVLVSGNGNAGWEQVREAYAQTGPDGLAAEVACTCRQGAIRLRMGPKGISLAKGTSRGWQRESILTP